VRVATGFVAGGTPAVGHATDLKVVADASLARYRWVWSAGGTPDTVYPVSLERLIAGSGATWVDVSTWG
jgi:prolyl-tRNA editing enzyme YbaK/EbsC (Cys-tRNA(Pro) deacylase)